MIGHNRASWLVVFGATLVIKNANVNIAMHLLLDGTGLNPLVKIQFQDLLYKGQLRQQEHSAGGMAVQSVAFPWNATWVRDPL